MSHLEREKQSIIGNIVTLTDRCQIVTEQAHAPDLSALADALPLSPRCYQEIPASKIILLARRHKTLYKNIKIYLATGLLARFIAATLRWYLNNILFHHNLKCRHVGCLNVTVTYFSFTGCEYRIGTNEMFCC